MPQDLLVTAEQLNAIGFANVTDSMVAELNRVLKKYNITTTENIRHFLAQCAVETAWGEYGASLIEKYNGSSPEEYFADRDFYYTNYNSDGTPNYYNNAPNNPAKAGDGAKYRGGGYIHLTWKCNYSEFAQYIGDSKILTEGVIYVANKYAWESAGWFWSIKNEINSKITSSTTVKEVTKMVNGGYNGLSEREAAYLKICEVIK